MERHAAARPDQPAVIQVATDGTRRSLSWSELLTGATRWSRRLLELGVKTGEPVAYQLPNRLEFVTLSLGILGVGAVCEPLMPIFRERELEFMLGASGARVLVVPDRFHGHDHATMARALMEPLAGVLEHVIVLDREGPDRERLDAVGGSGAFAPDPPTSAAPPDPPPLNREMPAQLLFTSGSTGEPKGVLMTHASLNTAAAIHTAHFGLGADDVIYIPSPLAHQTGFLYGMWIALTLGVPQVIQESWDAEIGFEAVRATGVTFTQAATPFLQDLVRVAAARDQTAGRLRTFVATGAAIPRELARDAREVLGAEVGGAFGTTESCLGAAFVPGVDDERAWSTDGRALDGITLRVVDDDGQTLEPGEEGNFEVLTPTLFEGYLNRPEATAQALTEDGYYRTGDLARIDADGYLKITGRVKDVINRGGEKVPVVEVEQLLYAHPAVREVAIVAMPDPRLGERACAFVVLEGDGELDLESMRRYLDASRVAKPYWPERLEIVDALPHTPSGKIQKFRLRERVSELIESEAMSR